MTDDPVEVAAANRTIRKSALASTADRLRKRLDPRLIASDVARIAMAQAITRFAAIQTSPKQRKRALVGAGVAAATAVGLRVVYRNSGENISPETQDDVTPNE